MPDSRMSRTSSAFTLIELLVVVAVIALLVTMLVPALGRARDLTQSAVCRSQLRQLWELFHDSGADMRFPAPRSWVEFIASRKMGKLVICPTDESPESTERALEEVYLVQDPGGLTFYPVLDIIEDPSIAPGIFQCRLLDRGGDVYEIWIGDYTGSDVLSESDADAAVTISLGDTVVITPLDPAGDGGPGDWIGCGSEHWLCHGPNCGTSGWKADIVRRLTGASYHVAEEPYTAVGAACSYGMNVNVAPIDASPQQVLLLDYEKTVADPDVDTVGGELQHLDPARHLGKVNAVFVDGSVHNLFLDEVSPCAPLWQP